MDLGVMAMNEYLLYFIHVIIKGQSIFLNVLPL